MKISIPLLEAEYKRASREASAYAGIGVMNREYPTVVVEYDRKTNTMDLIANLLWEEIQKQKKKEMNT